MAVATRPREDVLGLITANSRTPTEINNDVRAQIACVRLAQRRLDELTLLHGHERYAEGIALLLERSERAMRSRIAALPDGTWRGESYAENGTNVFPIHVTVTVDGSDLSIDFAGTAEQATNPYNATLANTYATVMTFLRGVLGADAPASAGSYRPLHITAPEGTIVNPRFPAAVAATTQVSYHSYEALMRAWEHVDPDAVIADCGAGGVYSWGGFNPRTGMLYAYGEALGGGSGALSDLDGEDSVMPPIANLRDTPAEALELDLPLRIERYELISGSGGSGRHRGGRGFRRVIRMLAPATWSIQISMSRRAPTGFHGGGSGRRTACTVERRDGTHEHVDRFTTLRLDAGDAIMIETAGGGGYGEDPAA